MYMLYRFSSCPSVLINKNVSFIHKKSKCYPSGLMCISYDPYIQLLPSFCIFSPSYMLPKNNVSICFSVYRSVHTGERPNYWRDCFFSITKLMTIEFKHRNNLFNNYYYFFFYNNNWYWFLKQYTFYDFYYYELLYNSFGFYTLSYKLVCYSFLFLRYKSMLFYQLCDVFSLLCLAFLFFFVYYSFPIPVYKNPYSSHFIRLLDLDVYELQQKELLDKERYTIDWSFDERVYIALDYLTELHTFYDSMLSDYFFLFSYLDHMNNELYSNLDLSFVLDSYLGYYDEERYWKDPWKIDYDKYLFTWHFSPYIQFYFCNTDFYDIRNFLLFLKYKNKRKLRIIFYDFFYLCHFYGCFYFFNLTYSFPLESYNNLLLFYFISINIFYIKYFVHY